jgi:hypothetical protein
MRSTDLLKKTDILRTSHKILKALQSETVGITAVLRGKV